MKHHSVILPVLLGASIALACCVGAGRAGSAKETPTIRLYSKSSPAARGLLVRVAGPVILPANGDLRFSYEIVNLLEEEVFVEVPNYEGLAYSYLAENGAEGAVGGGGRTAFPDNTAVLKRLHASSYTNGKRFTCACACATVRAQITPPNYVTAKGRMVVSIQVVGFYRSNGKEFTGLIDIPLPLQDLPEFGVRDEHH